MHFFSVFISPLQTRAILIYLLRNVKGRENVIITCQTSSHLFVVIVLKTGDLAKEVFKEWGSIFHQVTGYDTVHVAVASQELAPNLNYV